MYMGEFTYVRTHIGGRITTGKNVAAVRRDIAVCDSHGKENFAGRRKKIRTAKKDRTAKNN
jgi:hypothetical protein